MLAQGTAAPPIGLLRFSQLQPFVVFGLSSNLPTPSIQDCDIGCIANLYSDYKSELP